CVPNLTDALESQRLLLGRLAANEMTGEAACKAADSIGWHETLVEIPRAIEDARTGLGRISRIVQSVRSHAHLRDRECLAPINVNDQVKAALELARNEYKYDADAVVELGDVPRVLGDPGDLSLAILNLVVNAAHAIREKRTPGAARGTITVTTRGVRDRVEIAI